MILFFVSILKLYPVSFLGTLQRPSILLIFLKFLLTSVYSSRVTRTVLLLTLASTLNMITSLLNYNFIEVLKSYANFLITIAFLWFIPKIKNIKYLIQGLLLHQLFLILDVVTFLKSGSAILKGVFSSPNKYFPSGLAPEPSDAVVLLFLLVILLHVNGDRIKFIISGIILISYSIFFKIETFYFLLLLFVLGSFARSIIKNSLFTYSIFVLLAVTITYFQYTVFDFTLFNDSAHNRLTTPTYFIHASLGSPSLLWGHGFGSVATNYDTVILEYSQYFSTVLSVEQKWIIASNLSDNYSLFNFYARLLYEQGVIVFLIFFISLYKMVYKNHMKWAPFVLGTWFVSDLGPNLFLLAR